jgi:hypothetical protein
MHEHEPHADADEQSVANALRHGSHAFGGRAGVARVLPSRAVIVRG